MNYIEFTVCKAFTCEFKLHTNPVKAFNGMCVQLTSITFPVIWSSVLISVTREWRYCGLVYKFFLINNIELKCSFVRCRKYHKSLSNGAAELHISVDLLCGTTAAELNPVWCMHQESQTFSKDSKLKFNSELLKDERFGRFSKHRPMYALRRFSKLFKRWTLYEDSISDPRLKTFERWTSRTQKSPHELARQSEAKRRQAPHSEANVCRRRKCNLKKTSLINCTGHPIMHRTANKN